MKPIGKRVILSFDKLTKEDGTVELPFEALVVSSNNPDIPKGTLVVANPYGGIKIAKKESKKSIVVVVDEEDVHATL